MLRCYVPRPASEGNEQYAVFQFVKAVDFFPVSKAKGKRKEVLQDQSKKIGHYSDFRNALVHGMWDWSKDKPTKITATRIRRAEVL
jgi:hypothetical protein